jgi:opacity protein-like surface antigen
VLPSSAILLAAALMAAQAEPRPAVHVAVAVQAPPEQAPPQTEPQRPSKRTPRPPARKPAASGQGSFEESRTSRDGGPSRQELQFAANILGGYDDNIAAGLGSGPGTSTAMVSGATASVDGTLGFFRGNNLRSFQLDTTGSLIGYPNNLEDPAPAGSVNASVRTPMGRATTLGLSEWVSYDPLFNVLSPGAGVGPLPPGVAQTAPTTGLFERNSWSSSTGVSLDRRWGRRDTTTLGYTYRMQGFTDDDYGDNTWHNVAASYRRIASSQVKAGADYRYRNGEYADSQDLVRPTIEHRVEGVTELVGAPSRRRSYAILLAAGAGYLESVNASGSTFTSWLPVGRARLTLDASSNWSVEGGYQRDLSLLQGVTDDVYTTDTAYAAANGMLGRRTAIRIGATYSNWVTTVASGVSDTMDVYGATLGLRFRLTDALAATASYHYYVHRYSNPASLPEGFPAQYDRHAVRAGLTMFFPLAGTSSRQVSRW